MKIVFIGCTQFSSAMLNILSVSKDAEISGIVTKRSSLFNADFCSLEFFSEKIKVPCFFFDKNSAADLFSWISKLKPDVIYCFGWSHLLPVEIFKIPPLGSIGYHPTKLPQYRGRHPIIWSLALGLTQTASTFFVIDEGIDTGDILSQQIVSVTAEDNASSLYQKLILTAQDQVQDFTCQLSLLSKKLNAKSRQLSL